MADEPDNHTLALLREMRADSVGFQEEMRQFRRETSERFVSLEKRIENIRQLYFAESVLGRYTVAEVETRLDDLTRRLEALEAGR